MANTRKKQLFTLYEVDEFTEDFKNIWQYEDIDELLQDKKRHDIHLQKKHSIYQYITTTSDKIPFLLNDKYFIISEDIEEGATIWET